MPFPFTILPIKLPSVFLQQHFVGGALKHNWRSEAQLGSYIAAKKLALSAENIHKRLDWAIKHKDWTIKDWKKAIWSDECSVWIGVNPCQQWVIRPPGDGLGPLVVGNEGGIGAKEYEDILYDGLFDDIL